MSPRGDERAQATPWVAEHHPSPRAGVQQPPDGWMSCNRGVKLPTQLSLFVVSPSIFAARTKSLSVSPSILWVQIQTVTRPEAR